MPVCPNCRAKSDEEASFCPHCGSPLGAAEEAVRAAIERNSIALGLVAQGKLSDALDTVNEAIRLAPGHGPSYRNRADIFQRMGLTAQASADRQFASRLGTPQPPPQLASDDAVPSWWYRTREDAAISYAGFWIRLLATIIDSIALLVPQAFLALAVDDLVARLFGNLAVAAAYSIAFWQLNGATPGKMALGIRIVRSSGEPIGLSSAIVRYIGYSLSALILFIGYLMIAFSHNKRGLHDLIADTVVIKIR